MLTLLHLSFSSFDVKIVRRRVIPDPNEDRDTEEALKEFDFLVSDETDGGESRSAGDGTEWGKVVLYCLRHSLILTCMIV